VPCFAGEVETAGLEGFEELADIGMRAERRDSFLPAFLNERVIRIRLGFMGYINSHNLCKRKKKQKNMARLEIKLPD
jgi:hypothetical protein